ncbi:MAG TPA: YHS domain-containing protein [Dehalococcoidia bacterium]|nr:YHS domain-containing protein [Dehalococcoidia bacterium]
MTTPTQTVHDPVCHMDIEISSAAGRSDHEGKTYYFCSMGCKAEFDADTAGVLQRETEYDHSKGHTMMEMEHAGASRKQWWQFWKR